MTGKMPMKASAIVLLIWVLSSLAWITACPASPAGLLVHSAASGPFIRVDWQDATLLPRRFRNHCGFDRFHGGYYCSNHCGVDYQFYYCSQEAFGCCHVGRGYCGWNGLLRCSP
jgi:hypothetical protein